MRSWVSVTGMAVLAVALVGSIYVGLRSAEAGRNAELRSAALEQDVTKLQRSLLAVQGDADAFRLQALELDQALGEARQEIFRLEQENKRVLAETAVALDSLEVERASAVEREEEIVRLRREIFHKAASSPTRAESSVAVLPNQVSPPVPATIVLASGKADPGPGSMQAAVLGFTPGQQVVALGYGRRHGAADLQQVKLFKEQQPVANVVLTAVRADFSIGVVLPDSSAAQLLRRGEVLELILAD